MDLRLPPAAHHGGSPITVETSSRGFLTTWEDEHLGQQGMGVNWGDGGEGRAEGNWPPAWTESVDGGAVAVAAADDGGRMEEG